MYTSGLKYICMCGLDLYLYRSTYTAYIQYECILFNGYKYVPFI